ncbi:RNA-binding protein 14 [Eurosta solidaginis]|uniref:RNA-binding protein 14 n=1 Tax=Eurosta solidaginis TaxID=178769 RepID=UPI003530C424
MLYILNFIGLSLLLLCGDTLAQSGYNYARPEITNVAGGTSAGSASAVRPLVPLTNNAITTPTNVGGVGYPSATASGYGGTAASPFAGFGNQPSALGATGPTAYNAPIGASAIQTGSGGFNAPKRPILTTQQRGSANVYGGGLTNIASGQTAYSNAARVNSLNDLDYNGEGDYSAIPGVPAVDYPIYAQVPQTNFDCAQQLPGYYSDVEAQCQVFHICALNRTYSFLCPNGTIFSQETLVCVWWNQFECGSAPALYANNAYIYDYSNEQQRPAPTYSSSSSTAQLGARQQPTYPGASTNTGLRATAATLSTNSGIFGAGNLRSAAYGAVPSTITPVPSTTGYGANAVAANAGRFSAGSSSTPQSFNSAAAQIAPTQAAYGSANVGSGSSGISLSASPTNVNNNREYLPPPQRRTQ